MPLAMGARVVIAPAASMKDFAAVRNLISKHKVASFTGVPSALQVQYDLPCSFVGRSHRFLVQSRAQHTSRCLPAVPGKPAGGQDPKLS